MGKVTKDMGILDIVQQYPEAVAIFQKYGMGCIGCAAARFENLEAGARVHGFDPDEMVADINADRKSTRLNSSHANESRMPSSA